MPANAFLTTAAIGNREDLVDVIYNTAPTDTPLISAIDKVKATAVTHEWQRDILATPANNAVAEGADATYTAVVPTARLSNQTQISRKSFSISDTQETVNKAGRKSEIRYQTVKQGKELRKDMELACIENGTLTTGATRQTRGLRGWIVTNNSLGSGGVAPNIGTNTAPTDGTLRGFTEAILRTIVLGAFQNGGNPEMLIVAPAIKQVISSSFTGNGTKFIKGEVRKLEGAWDIYQSDFGDFKIVPNRVMQRTREAYLVDPSLCALAVLRDMQDQELARIGAARNYMIETEYALEVREERGLACARDIQ
ncbi:hypothetical protein IP84_17020 [beta proteobacterium AAP99]|nr:hypothetical protein IP84_17020 [beta proteobacterium AAP99]